MAFIFRVLNDLRPCRIEPLEQGTAPLFASLWHVLLFQMPFRSNEQIPTLRHYPGVFLVRLRFPLDFMQQTFPMRGSGF
ncbi:hypothetical protein VXQ18_04820 [Brucella abortus]|nr:hypothetical protein [Brucella abortus]